MSLKDRLENLKSKPEHIKGRIAFAGAFSITAIIFVFWLGTVTTIGRTPSKSDVSISKVGTPVESLIAGVGSFFVDIRNMIFGAKKIQYSNIEVLPGKK